MGLPIPRVFPLGGSVRDLQTTASSEIRGSSLVSLLNPGGRWDHGSPDRSICAPCQESPRAETDNPGAICLPKPHQLNETSLKSIGIGNKEIRMCLFKL